MKKHTQRGFTLIELLVVITIIAILMGLAIPAVTTALQAAKKAEAATMMNQLRAALTMYQTEYNTYPACLPASGGGDIIIAAGGGATDWQELYEVLTATAGTAGGGTTSATITSYNPRRIAFMEIPPKYAGTADPKSIFDPWGIQYGLAIDANFDSQLVGVPDPANPTGTKTINGAYALWTFGVDDINTATPAERKRGMVCTYK